MWYFYKKTYNKKMSNKNILVTGGFDPIHSGHTSYLKAAKEIGGVLWVGINSDKWLSKKKGQFFMDIDERIAIVSSLRVVDHAFAFNDTDKSANAAIQYVLDKIPKTDKLVFANGGDRNSKNIPELDKFFENKRVSFEFGVGGNNKKNSSSWILENWKNQKTERKWGYYKIFNEREGVKVKELVISGNSSLSDQKHFLRSEHWYILEGGCKIFLEKDNIKSEVILKTHDSLIIEKGTWHKAINLNKNPCSVLEVQYGGDCIEEDIEIRQS